ncbi:MAG: TetR/AcrR family transcriptional regulator [Gemmatimonadaceae bacterium]|nr:TetR/AcrR family transcriptional regulator [Gemmatimonadaceae bacterium]
MIEDHRHRILHAAARVYAQHGWRGATTRRIAEEAGVNEVTIFRQFGSKDALLEIAMRECARLEQDATLPHEPAHPERELYHWIHAHHASLSNMRDIVRQMMSEAAERPETAICAAEGPSGAFAQLRQYVVQLRRHGWISEPEETRPGDVRGAVTMLMGAIFADAMNREIMPAMFPQTVDDSLHAYVRIFLRGIGVSSEPTPSVKRTPRRPISISTSTAE